jgi:hypothetical protein
MHGHLNIKRTIQYPALFLVKAEFLMHVDRVDKGWKYVVIL